MTLFKTRRLVLYYFDDFKRTWLPLYLRRWGRNLDGTRTPCHWTYAELYDVCSKRIPGFLSLWKWNYDARVEINTPMVKANNFHPRIFAIQP